MASKDFFDSNLNCKLKYEVQKVSLYGVAAIVVVASGRGG